MGMSTSVIGIRPSDDKFKKMYKAYMACEELGIEPPDIVRAFFENDTPDEKGVVVWLDEHICCQEYTNDYQQGYEVYLDKLPKDIKIIRFVNSY